MTPQAPPPHSGTDYSVASPNIPTNAVDNSRKRKRHEDREVIDVDLSTPFPESPVLSVKNSRTVMIFLSKKQTVRSQLRRCCEHSLTPSTVFMR